MQKMTMMPTCLLACLLAGSVNAQERLQEKSVEYLDTLGSSSPEDFSAPDKFEKVIHLYKDEEGERYALQAEINKETGGYNFFKHYLNEEDDIYLEKLGIPLKYLPDVNLQYPDNIKPKNKGESETMRATSFVCPNPINVTPTNSSTSVSGHIVYIQYSPFANGKNSDGSWKIGRIYGNAAICQPDTTPQYMTGTPPKHHHVTYSVITQNYDGQASHTSTLARYKFQNSGNYGVGMYFGNAGAIGSCTGAHSYEYLAHPNSENHNTRIETWSGPNNSSQTSYTATCGRKWGDNIWYRVHVDASTNYNNSQQTSKYWVNRLSPPWSAGNPTSSWTQSYHTGPVQKTMSVANFDEDAAGLFIVALLPSEVVPNPKPWNIFIVDQSSWWANY